MDDKRLTDALLDTWNAIGNDLEEAELDNESAIEAVLDAGHLEMYGLDREKADGPTRAAVAEFRRLSWQQQKRKAKKLLGNLV